MSAALVAALWAAASVVLAVGVASFIRASTRHDVAEEAEAYLRALARRRPGGALVGVRVAAAAVVLGAVVTVSFRTVGDLPRRIITAASAHADLIGGGDGADPSTEGSAAAPTTGKHQHASARQAATRTTPTTTRPGDAGPSAAVGVAPTPGATAADESAMSPTTTTTLALDTTEPGTAHPPDRSTTTTTTPPDGTGGFASPSRRPTTTTTTSTTTPPETTTTTAPPETTTTTAPPETTTTTTPPETTTTTAPPEPSTAS